VRFLCDAKKFFESIGNGEDREAFLDEFGSPERFSGGILVDLPRSKSLKQLGLIFRDLTIAAGYLHTTKETCYYWLLRSELFADVWLVEKRGKLIFRTLSGLSKKETSEFIPRMRDFFQNKINEEYGEYVPIEWSGKNEPTSNL